MTNLEVTFKVYFTYKLIWKTIFDGWILGVLNRVIKVGDNRTKLVVTKFSWYTAGIS